MSREESFGSEHPANVYDCAMSQVSAGLNRLYPALMAELLSVPENEMSDSRLLAQLASHIVDLFEAGRTDDVIPAFEFAEQLIASGSEKERHAAVVGFLETVQNVSSHRKSGPVAFERFLGPTSQVAWKELNEVWSGKMTLAEVVASETGAALRPPWWKLWKRRAKRSPRELLRDVENAELRKIIEQITRE